MEKETRVYIINCSDTDFDFRRAEYQADTDSIKTESEKLGTVYSLKGFQDAINDEELNLSNSFILVA